MGLFWNKNEESSFVRLALKPDLDEDTAYTLCQLISFVGHEISSYNWDWEWATEKRGNFRSLITRSLAKSAWGLLADKEQISLQTTDDEGPWITTVAPLEAMAQLQWLVLQDNRIADLRPLSGMSQLKYLNLYTNKVADLSPLAQLQSLEDLNLAHNPIESFDPLAQLPKLRRLALSTDQVPCFTRCRRLPSIEELEITGEDPVESCVTHFPEMPSLKILRVDRLKDTAGLEKLLSVRTLELLYGRFSNLDGIAQLQRLTHLEAWSSEPLSLQPLSRLYALRRAVILSSSRVIDLQALSRLPVLHEVCIGDSSHATRVPCDSSELERLRQSLTPWSDEFKASEQRYVPSLDIEIVTQETLDQWGVAAHGIKPGECQDGMIASEGRWLQQELIDSIEALHLKHGDSKDFMVTNPSAFARSLGLVLHSLRACESLREILTAVQQVLCEARNDWVIHFQELALEGPEWEDVPEGMEDFSAWVYPDTIRTTKAQAALLRKLLG